MTFTLDLGAAQSPPNRELEHEGCDNARVALQITLEWRSERPASPAFAPSSATEMTPQVTDPVVSL